MGLFGIPKMTYAYLRISTNQSKQNNSFLVQEKALREKFQIDSVIKEAISGSAELDKRKALLTMIDNLKNGDKVVIYRMDRISRDTIKAGWIQCEIKKRGAELLSLEIPQKDHTRALIETILTAFAQYEKEVIRFRIQQTLDSKKARGEALGGKYPPYGFDFEIREGKKFLVRNALEQEIIKSIKRFRIKSTNEICKILRMRRVLGKSGKPISYKQVQTILQRIKEGFYND